MLCPAQAIGVLHEAGVNVWMITGDKAETGLAIGEWLNVAFYSYLHSVADWAPNVL